jgi:hypothetical protein
LCSSWFRPRLGGIFVHQGWRRNHIINPSQLWEVPNTLPILHWYVAFYL